MLFFNVNLLYDIRCLFYKTQYHFKKFFCTNLKNTLKCNALYDADIRLTFHIVQLNKGLQFAILRFHVILKINN